MQKNLLFTVAFTALGFGVFFAFLLKKHHDNMDRLSSEIQQHKQILVEGTVSKITFNFERILIHIRIKTIIFDSYKNNFYKAQPIVLVEHDRSEVEHWNCGDSVAILACPQKINCINKAYYEYLRRSESIVCTCRKIVSVRLLHSPRNFSLKRNLTSLRKTLSANLDLYKYDLGHDVVQILKAWTLGLRFGVNSALKKSFQNSGTYHIFAISGLHVTLVYTLFVALFCRMSLTIFFLILIVFFSFFPFLTGQGASVVRASLILLFTQFFQKFGRPLKREQSFFLVFFVMILFNPQKMSDWSFVLSFSSIAVLLIATDQNSFLSKKPLWNPILLSICLSLGTIPLTISFFHRWVWIGILANIIVMPLSICAIYQAFFLMLFGFFDHMSLVSFFMKSILIPLERMTVETILTVVAFLEKEKPYTVNISVDSGRLYLLIIFSILVIFSSRKPSFRTSKHSPIGFFS